MPGAYWSGLLDTIIYQSSVPLIYVSEFTMETQFKNCAIKHPDVCENSAAVVCQYTRFLNHLNVIFNEHLLSIHRSLGSHTATKASGHFRKLGFLRGSSELVLWSFEKTFGWPCVFRRRKYEQSSCLSLAVNEDLAVLISLLGSIKNCSLQMDFELLNSKS